MANGEKRRFRNIGNRIVPHTNPSEATDKKLLPVMNVGGTPQTEKISLADLHAHLLRTLPFLTESQMQEVTDSLAGALRSLENRMLQVEQGNTGGGGGGSVPTYTTGGGRVLYGFADTTQDPPTTTGTALQQDYPGLPSSVRLSFPAIPDADTGWYIQLPAGVTVASVVNTSVPSDPQRDDTWVAHATHNRWVTGDLPPGTIASFTFTLQAVGGAQQPSGGTQPPSGGAQPSVPSSTTGSFDYGRINASGVPQGTSLVHKFTQLPQTFADVAFPAGVDDGDGWFITVPAGVRVSMIQHRQIDGELRDLTSFWAYDDASRTYTRTGQFPGVPGLFTITVGAVGG